MVAGEILPPLLPVGSGPLGHDAFTAAAATASWGPSPLAARPIDATCRLSHNGCLYFYYYLGLDIVFYTSLQKEQSRSGLSSGLASLDAS